MYGIPIWFITNTVNYFGKFYKPKKGNFIIGISGIGISFFTTLICMEEINQFSNWID